MQAGFRGYRTKIDLPRLPRAPVRLPRGLACLCFLATQSACNVVVTPPANPKHPTIVYFCDYGVHSSLLLPVGQNRYVEYLYGDWNWAALYHIDWTDAVKAIFWSKQATLGRRYITQISATTMPTPPGEPKLELAIAVDGESCQKVVEAMDLRWEQDRAAHPDNESILTDFWYVKDDQHYSWLHDCNLNTAQTLASLGCNVRGFAVFSNFKVTPKP